jgi:hypothetical protein
LAIEFKCPRCRGGVLEQLIVGAIVSATVLSIEDEELDAETIDVDGHVERYQCLNCGFIPRDAMGVPYTYLRCIAEAVTGCESKEEREELFKRTGFTMGKGDSRG